MAVVLRYVLMVSLCSAVYSLEEIIDLCGMELKCQLPQKVSVPIAKGNKQIYPSTVLIERCSGGFLNYECQPQAKNDTENVIVRVSNGKTCQDFNVTRHLRCKPKPLLISKNKCTKERRFNKKTGTCVCRKPCTTGSQPDENCKCVKMKRN